MIVVCTVASSPIPPYVEDPHSIPALTSPAFDILRYSELLGVSAYPDASFGRNVMMETVVARGINFGESPCSLPARACVLKGLYSMWVAASLTPSTTFTSDIGP